ncbi:chemotaxis protein CheZ [Thermovibrio guaymasensis]|uniref:Chemotaxis protein CheZ n=1 Tax=Thermovibrio guaymasensis TaxID=240167 RepID=A0A420W929_9BACT|nr:hypothetical protein [Thermovibrio guaymasensis]RKQ63817.1 chemotaxis protein CheZ [Thermovibrio guaymasensis]
MEKNLLKEVKELLDLVKSFKDEISDISKKKEGFSLANDHIESAISESEEATKRLIESIGKTLEDLNYLLELSSQIEDESLREKLIGKLKEIISRLTSDLTLLEFQDILAQRLLKVKSFLNDIEKSILRIALLVGIEEMPAEEPELRKKMEELQWKREITQEDVDEIMKQFGL